MIRKRIAEIRDRYGLATSPPARELEWEPEFESQKLF
jgi:hypothetical protein